MMTGFPGFLGSALLPRLLARREGMSAVCLVQPRFLAESRHRLDDIEAAHPDVAGRVQLVEGDITEADLGIDDASRQGLGEVAEVWHLAAVYDPAVTEDLARRVNVDGTARVLDFCRQRGSLTRLHYVSTCYVSGHYDGEFTEDMLDEGQSFANHYVSTKFEAEKLVRAAMAEGLPVTIYRPGMVVGDSTTGETQKYDGPYFAATFLRRQLQPRVVIAPYTPAMDRVRVAVVPRDFVVAAMDELSVQPDTVGMTFALADPDPPTPRQLLETFARLLDRRLVWVRVPLGMLKSIVGSVPGLERIVGLPAEALDYFDAPSRYPTTNTVKALEGTGVTCPPFADYAATLLDYMTKHPEINASAMA